MKQFDHIFRHVDKILDDAFDRSELGKLSAASWKPALDIYEQGDRLVVIVDLPGVNKKEINVTIEGSTLTISGVRPSLLPADKHTCHRIEIHQGPFRRSIRLNVPVQRDAVSATYRNGLLRIEIPKEEA